jgi:hypothetical protein
MTIEAIQRDLERSQRGASRSDDRELAIRVREEGHRLAFLLHGLVRALRLSAPDNAALDSLTTDVAAVVRRLLDLVGTVRIAWAEDQVFVNDVRIRVRSAEQRILDQLIADLDRHETGGLSFHAPIDAAQAKALALAIGEPAGPAGAARAALNARLRACGEIVANGRYRFKRRGERPTIARSRQETLLRGAQAVHEAALAVCAERIPNLLPVRRAAIELVEALWDNPGWAAAAPFWRGACGAAERHMVSVAALSLRIGQVLGLSDPALSDLGVSAMLHDVGYGAGGPGHRHQASGARALLRQRGFHEGKLRRVLTVLEHRLPFEPDPADDGAVALRPGLFARIIRIADDYDLLLAVRGDAPQVSPAMVQGSMWSARGTTYDPDLLALFVQILGLYPPGTVLALDDGRWAVGVSGGRDRERFAAPVVRVVRRADGEPLAEPEDLDLHELRASARPRRILSPATHALDVAAIVDAAFGDT